MTSNDEKKFNKILKIFRWQISRLFWKLKILRCTRLCHRLNFLITQRQLRFSIFALINARRRGSCRCDSVVVAREAILEDDFA
jgi:hypothetical protein